MYISVARKLMSLKVSISALLTICIFVTNGFVPTQAGEKSREWQRGRLAKGKQVPLEQAAFHIFFNGSTFIPCGEVRSMPENECVLKQNYMMYITTLALMIKNFGFPIYRLNSPYTVYNFPQFSQFYGSYPEGYNISRTYDVGPLFNKYRKSQNMEGASYLVRCLKQECSRIVRLAKHDGGVWSQIWRESIEYYSCEFEMFKSRRQIEQKLTDDLTPEQRRSMLQAHTPRDWYKGKNRKTKDTGCGVNSNTAEIVDFTYWNLFFGHPTPPSF